MTTKELEDVVKDYIKDYLKKNLAIKVEEKNNSSECSYANSTYANLYLEDELISSSEIQELAKSY
jgi:hypothetical protein